MRTDLNRRSLGAEGERMAAEFLIANNYKILKTNFRVGRLGEIDIIAREKEYICFIEVKTRRTLSFGSPGEAVTPAKQQKIRQIAAIYISNSGSSDQCIRFDVVEVIMSKTREGTNKAESINLIRNAF